MKIKKIKSNLIELISNSTAYGVAKTLKSKRLVMRIFWLLFIVFGSAASAYYVQNAIVDYFNYDVSTKIESVYQHPMAFPTLTICPHRAKAFDNKQLQDLIENFEFSLDARLDLNKYFEAFYSQGCGKCFRFNSGSNGNQSIPVLNSTIGGRDDSFFLVFKPTVNTGLLVWVHEPKLPPKIEYMHSYHGNVNQAPYGLDTQLILHKTVDKRIGLPYHDCFKDVSTEFPLNKTLINFIESTGEKYTQVNCYRYCFDLYYMNTNPCNCSNTSLSNVWKNCFIESLIGQNQSNCELEDCFYKLRNQQDHCTFKAKLNFFKNLVLNECKEYCPLECDSIEYSVSYSVVTPVPSLNSSRLIVYFESLKYTLISQEAKMQEFDLISKVGGLFGLFIGVSFVSIFELIELIIEILIVLFEQSEKTYVDE